MADVDHRHALVAELVDDGEQRFDLCGGQRRGRLVKDQDLTVRGDGLRDLNQLHLGNAQGSQLRSRVEIQVDFLQDAGGVLIHLVVINDRDRPDLLCGIASNKDILANGALRDRLQLLMDHGDTAVQRVQRTVDLHLLTLIDDLTLIHVVNAEHAFHQC